MKLVGIDFAWHCHKNPTAIAFGNLIDGVLSLSAVDVSVLPVDQIVKKINSIDRIFGIAIDASLIIPNNTGQRGCEKAVSKYYGTRKAACHASNTTLYPEAASVELSRQLQVKGFKHLSDSKWQIECYPHPAIIEIFGLPCRLAYKKGTVAEKRAGQKQLASRLRSLSNSTVLPLQFDKKVRKHFDDNYIDGLRGKELKSNEDALDAVICLYIAGLYAIHSPGRLFGDVSEGYIWVPQGSVLAK